ncbi:MAG TPA: hypothetical protein VGF98_04125 [Candidatus Tumulicola sp.]
MNIRRGLHAFLICAIVTVLSACGGSQTTTPSNPFCPVSKPFVELLYPIPGTTGVATSVGQMVFASTGVTRIQLATGSYTGEKVRTKPEPLPNPLPTPIATPGPYAQYLTTTFAVSFVTLHPNTHYDVRSWEVPNPCAPEPFPPSWANLGSFTTQ